MEFEENPSAPPQSSPFIFLRNGQDDAKFALCSISDIRNSDINVKKTDNLRGKKLYSCHYGWFVLTDKEFQFSLWNPFTLEFIRLPLYDLTPELRIIGFIVTSPPHESESRFVFFERTYNCFFFCKIGDEQWTKVRFKQVFGNNENYHKRMVSCNGMIYGLVAHKKKLIKIDLSKPDDDVLVFDLSKPRFRFRPAYWSYLVEFCNELFIVRLHSKTTKELKVKEVVGVRVLKLDFSNMEWKNVESFEDKAFFITRVSTFCCSVTRENSFKGNCVYFVLDEDKNIYSFNKYDKTISIFLRQLSPSNSVYKPTWIMIDSRFLDGETYKNELDNGEEEMELDSREIVRHSSTTAKEDDEGGEFDKLLLDALFNIGKRIILCDYISFRFVNKTCRVACPPWTAKALEGFEDYNHTPWLTYWDEGDSFCECLDPLRNELYFMNLPNNTLKNVTLCHTSLGWCVMLQGEKCIFLWNPLTKKTVLLPNLHYSYPQVTACSLTSTTDVVFLLHNFVNGYVGVQIIYLKEGKWHSQHYVVYLNVNLGMDSNVIYYNRHLYIFSVEGNLIIQKKLEGVGAGAEWNFQRIHDLTSPCPDLFDKSFLVECGGKIMSIFVGLHREWIKIFTLDFDNRIWFATEDLGYKTIYISRFSCFSSTPPSSGMENRLYFPRYYGKNKRVVYYCLTSKKLHAHGTEEALENLCDTKEQLFSYWVETKW